MVGSCFPGGARGRSNCRPASKPTQVRPCVRAYWAPSRTPLPPSDEGPGPSSARPLRGTALVAYKASAEYTALCGRYPTIECDTAASTFANAKTKANPELADHPTTRADIVIATEANWGDQNYVRNGVVGGFDVELAREVCAPGMWEEGGGGAPRDASEGRGPQRRPQRRLGRRLEEVAEAVGGGYCRYKCR